MRKEVKVFIIFPCVQTFFQLVSGELAWWCSRNLGFNMKLPASYWVGALVPAEELSAVWGKSLLFLVILGMMIGSVFFGLDGRPWAQDFLRSLVETHFSGCPSSFTGIQTLARPGLANVQSG